MKRAQLVLSDAAVADILEQADWYTAQSGPALAERWEKAVTSAVLRVVKNPGGGTPSSELLTAPATWNACCEWEIEFQAGILCLCASDFPDLLAGGRGQPFGPFHDFDLCPIGRVLDDRIDEYLRLKQ